LLVEKESLGERYAGDGVGKTHAQAKLHIEEMAHDVSCMPVHPARLVRGASKQAAMA